MSLRTDLLPVVDGARDLLSPSNLDQRTSALTIRQRTWDGGRAGAGTPTDDDTALPQRYRIDTLSAKEVHGSGGRYRHGDVKVVVTPSHTGGGYTLAQLRPTVATGVEVVYVITGALAGDYELVELKASRPYRYELILRRTKD